jgi:hypothetical protein
MVVLRRTRLAVHIDIGVVSASETGPCCLSYGSTRSSVPMQGKVGKSGSDPVSHYIASQVLVGTLR